VFAVEDSSTGDPRTDGTDASSPAGAAIKGGTNSLRLVDRLAMQQYLDRCQTLIILLNGLLSAETLNQAQHLLDHGEPSIGLEYLAHGIVNQQVQVSAGLLAELRELVLDPAELPPDLDTYTVP
jgi:hypothetical protein